MNSQLSGPPVETDPAAVFACAISLWKACHESAKADSKINLSDAYQGIDELMRQAMRIGEQFETWCCSHVCFEGLSDVWPYMLEDKFGHACLRVLLPTAVDEFDERDCLRVALRLRLPVKFEDNLPVPVDVSAVNPVIGSGFREFRIQTVRHSVQDDVIVPFCEGDEPFDEEFGPPHFGVYGVCGDGLLEHIADRASYRDARDLMQNLIPGIEFPLSSGSVR